MLHGQRGGSRVAQQVSILLLCDLHGNSNVEAEETISFGVSNASYEIDVCQAHGRELQSKFAPFVEHARRQTGGQPGKRGRRAADRAHTAEVRAWAKEHGHKISERAASRRRWLLSTSKAADQPASANDPHSGGQPSAGTPEMPASSTVRRSCQPCESSTNQVTVRPPRRRHPHRAARPATS